MDLFETFSDTLALTDFGSNDTFSTASTIDDGRFEVQGNGEDWYRFEAPAGQMAFSITATEAPLNLALTLHDAAGNAIKGSPSPTATESFDFYNAADQTYYLRVATAQYAATTPPADLVMTYTITVDLPDTSNPDGNDTLAEAQTLTEGLHNISGSAVDWFHLNSPSGNISITLDTDDDAYPQNLNAVLYNAAGQVLGHDNNPSGEESFTALLKDADDYFLKVFWAVAPDATSSGIKLDYTLDIDLPEEAARDPNDPGETRETATPLPANGTHSIEGTGLDWFRLDTGPGRFTIDMTDTSDGSNEINMDLYDAQGNLLIGNREAGGTESVSYLSQTGGTYYINMFMPIYPNGTPNGVTMNYDLTVDTPENTWATTLDFGPIRNASIAVFDIDNDGKDEIFVSASKALDEEGNEIRPGGLIVLEDDGTIKWTKTFEAEEGPDLITGKEYNTSSVSTQAIFSDLTGDGRMEIIIGTAAGITDVFPTSGQPGDKGGIYALTADGEILWFHETYDVFGSHLDEPDDSPDGRSEGVYSTPRIFDIDADGQREILVTSWDQRFYILDGKTGQIEREFNLHDTAAATPNVADMDGDGIYELVVLSAITDNEEAGIPTQGGVVHVLTNYAQPIIEGWTDQVSIKENASADHRGKFLEQGLWSSPKVTDLDGDGTPEFIHGTTNFFKDERGQFLKIWNADGTERATLTTIGQPRAAPLLADLDGNGSLEIIAATMEGYVYGWNSNGVELFRTLVEPYVDTEIHGDVDRTQPITRQPIAVDLDNADGDLEILVSIGSQTIVLDSDGTQITSTTQENSNNIYQVYSGSPVAKDIDHDGKLDLLSGGTTEAQDQAVIFRWENPFEATSDDYRTAEYQNMQSLNEVRSFVERFYNTVLDRSADPQGSNFWTDSLATGVLSGADVAAGFIGSKEFIRRNTSDEEYVNILYEAFFGRNADAGGFGKWINDLDSGVSRADVLAGFTGSREFENLTTSYGIRAETSYGIGDNSAVILGDPQDSNVLRGGAGNNILNDEGGEVTVADNIAHIEYTGQVYRLYGAALGRNPDMGGLVGWLNALDTGRIPIADLPGYFLKSPEFIQTYGDLDDANFVNLLYQNVLGRNADAQGQQNWVDALDGGLTRDQVVLNFSDSRENRTKTSAGFDNFMTKLNVEWLDVLEGGAGDDVMNAGIGSDIFIFRADEPGNDTVHGFEPWDRLQLSGYGFDTDADALAQMQQVGDDVIFEQGQQRIRFVDMRMSYMNEVQFNI